MLLALLSAWSMSAAAWGGLGHEVVAALAEAELQPATRARLQPLLELEQQTDLAALASWADRVRETDAYAWTVPLHFINFPGRSCPAALERSCPDGRCVVAAVERYAAELADAGRSPAQRLEALKFLVHFVADLHQPLHAGRAEDKGGNTYQISIDGRGSNLHQVWDRELLASRGWTRDEYVAQLRQTPLPAAGSDSAMDWALESCQLVNAEGFYPKGHTLDSSYLSRQRDLAEQRLRLAAVRLARLLERNLTLQ